MSENKDLFPPGVVESLVRYASVAPDALAITAGTASLTYGQLEVGANQLAHTLKARGVGPEIAVGLLMERSPESIVGALAVWKAGGAYVALDPAYPAERLAFMLRDAGISVVVSDTATARHLPEGASQLVLFDRDRATIAAQPPTPPERPSRPADLAYVIYTSGTTGQPKGVMISQGNLANLVAWHRDAFAVTAADRASQVAGFGFDAAVWEIWPYLAAGASVHLADDAIRAEPESLRDWMVDQRITIGYVPTVLAEHMMSLPWPTGTALRYLLTGADTLRRCPAAGLPFTLVNNYGPTECTVVTTSGVIPPGEAGNQLPSIGRPIRNLQVYILDQNMYPVAGEALGELYVGGAGVARGYLNRPELTAERFLDDPVRGRLYRTGDLGRFLPDGQIAFAGRKDNQIKIRGYRIEPDEIAAAINRYPGVQSSVVGAVESAVGEKRLVAYLVASKGAAIHDEFLTGFLRLHLPEYMIPAEFLWLEGLPLTPNGKVDMRALPKPAAQKTQVVAGASIEERLRGILQSLLQVGEIQRDDNFFLLGGHSLMGAQLIAKVRETFAVDLSLRNLFEAPSIATLSAAIATRPARRAGASK